MKIDKSLSIKLTEVNVLMTVLIVWLHTAPSFDLPRWIQQIAIIAVPCFWTISSFLYFANFDFTSPWTSYKTKLNSRVHTIFVPFIVFNIFSLVFSLILYQIHPVIIHPLEGVNADNILSTLYHSKWNGALWYLRALFEFVLIAPLIGYIIRADKLSIVLVIPIYFLCQYAPYSSFPYWLVNIYTGAYIAIWYGTLNRCLSVKKVKICVLMIVIGTVISSCILGIDNDYMIRAVVPPIVLLLIKNSHIIPPQIAIFLAPYTMLIYCLHGCIIRVTSKVPSLFAINSEFFSFVITVVLTIFVIVMFQIFMKRCPRIWKFIMGGR